MSSTSTSSTQSQLFETTFTKCTWKPNYDPNITAQSWKQAVAAHIAEKCKDPTSVYAQIAVARDEVPKGAITHTGLVSYLFTCWRDEAGVSLRPDMIAGTILRQIAKHICEKPDPYRHLYTNQSAKTKLVVTGPQDEISIDVLTSMISSCIPNKDLVQAFMTDFDSAPPGYRRYAKMCLLQSGIAFFDFESDRCGIPVVEIVGSTDDWLKLLGMMQTIAKVFGAIMVQKNRWSPEEPCPIAQLAIRAQRPIRHILKYAFGETAVVTKGSATDTSYANSKDFFSKLFFAQENCESGHPHYCRGWFNDFDINDDARPIWAYSDCLAYVPYDDLDTKRCWYYASGLVHSLVDRAGKHPIYRPQYAGVKHEVLDRELFNKIAMRDAPPSSIGNKNKSIDCK